MEWYMSQKMKYVIGGLLLSGAVAQGYSCYRFGTPDEISPTAQVAVAQGSIEDCVVVTSNDCQDKQSSDSTLELFLGFFTIGVIATVPSLMFTSVRFGRSPLKETKP